MSNNRKSLVSDIRNLDRGIADAEKFLGKVLAKKIETARRDATPVANKKKNVSKRSTRSESRTPPPPQSRPRASSAHIPGVSGVTTKPMSAIRTHITRNSSRISSSKKVTSELHPSKYRTDGPRSRSNSTNMSVPLCKCEPGKQSGQNKPQTATYKSVMKNAHHTSPRRPPTPTLNNDVSPQKSKHIPWREILRDPHKPGCKLEKAQWDIASREQKYMKQSCTSGNKQSCINVKHIPCIGKQAGNYNSKLLHDCELLKTDLSCPLKVIGECNNLYKESNGKTEDSFSSEGTSGFSSTNEVQSNIVKGGKSARNTAPQGARPKSVPVEACGFQSSGSSSGASVHKSEDRIKRIAGILGNDVFTVFNPVRTLQFLVKELQGMVQKNSSDDGSVSRIVTDMQRVLQRLSEKEEKTDSSSGYTTHSKPNDTNSIRSCSSCFTTDKHMDMDREHVAIIKALAMVPALAKRIDERTESMRKKILESKVTVSVPQFKCDPLDPNTSSVENIMSLQRHVENSGGQLEAMCRTMEKTCDSLRNERDELKTAVETKNSELTMARRNEQDFITTINSLRLTLESTTRRATQLSVENKMMKEQFKLLPGLQESEVKVKQLTAELNLLREEVKDIPHLRASAEELKAASVMVAMLRDENKELPALKLTEEKYKHLTQENARLREENKVLPHIKDIEHKVVQLTHSLESIKEEKKQLEEKFNQCNQEKVKLREELQNKTGLKEVTQRLTEKLQETMKERDQALHEQNMLKIECEKLILLGRNKEEELSGLIKDILNIKTMVGNQLTCLKSSLKTNTPSISEVLNTSSDSDEGTVTTNTADTATYRQPVCSSPTSTQSLVPLVGDDWNNISAIIPDHTHSSPEIRLKTNTRKEETKTSEFKSLEVENWQSLVPVGQGEVNVPEDYPPRPRTAVGGPRPPITGVPVGDNQWVGAAPITQELQNNMQELFHFIHHSHNTSGESVSRIPSLVSIPSRTANTATVTYPATMSGAASLASITGSCSGLSSASSKNTCKPTSKPQSSASRRNFQFKMPKLPDPPKFLDVPEFSEFSSYPCSLTESTSSIESLDAMLKKLKGEPKRKNNKNGK